MRAKRQNARRRPLYRNTATPLSTNKRGRYPFFFLQIKGDATLFSFWAALSGDIAISYPQSFPIAEQTSPFHKADLFRCSVAAPPRAAARHPRQATTTSRESAAAVAATPGVGSAVDLPSVRNGPRHLTSDSPLLSPPCAPARDCVRHNESPPTNTIHPTATRKNALATRAPSSGATD